MSYNCTSGNYKTVFFAWPFEGLADLADRVEVLGTVVGWFGGCETYPSETPTLTSTPTLTITPDVATVTPIAMEDFQIYLPIIWK